MKSLLKLLLAAALAITVTAFVACNSATTATPTPETAGTTATDTAISTPEATPSATPTETPDQTPDTTPDKPDECKHENTELINQKDATETEAGYTGDTVCKDCTKKIEDGTVIPKLNPMAWFKVTAFSYLKWNLGDDEMANAIPATAEGLSPEYILRVTAYELPWGEGEYYNEKDAMQVVPDDVFRALAENVFSGITDDIWYDVQALDFAGTALPAYYFDGYFYIAQYGFGGGGPDKYDDRPAAYKNNGDGTFDLYYQLINQHNDTFRYYVVRFSCDGYSGNDLQFQEWQGFGSRFEGFDKTKIYAIGYVDSLPEGTVSVLPEYAVSKPAFKVENGVLTISGAEGAEQFSISNGYFDMGMEYITDKRELNFTDTFKIEYGGAVYTDDEIKTILERNLPLIVTVRAVDKDGNDASDFTSLLITADMLK